jgi:hypothetical protein
VNNEAGKLQKKLRKMRGKREGKTVKLMSLAHFTASSLPKSKTIEREGENSILKLLLCWKIFGLDLIAEAVWELVLMVSVEPWEKQIVRVEFLRWKKGGFEE